MNRSLIYTILFLICILSRLITSINYLEDYQSALMAYDVKNSDLLSVFQGFHHPVFITLVKIFSLVTNNIFLGFSIVGGISVYLIIYYTLSILKTPLASLEGGLVALLIFFNPIVWISSNRFTPELLGAGLAITSFYFLLSDTENRENKSWIGWLIAGLLLGVFPVFFLFLIFPLIYSIFKKKKVAVSFASLTFGAVLWYIPLFFSGTNHALLSTSDFLFPNDFDYGIQEKLFLGTRSLWAGVLNGYWKGRSWFTLYSSVTVLPFLFFGMLILLSFDYDKVKIITTGISVALLVVVLFIYFPMNHASLCIIIPFIAILISYGIIYFLVNFNSLLIKAVILIFILSEIYLGVYFSRDHRKPTAVEQVRQYLSEKRRDDTIITSTDQLQKYLQLQGFNTFQINSAPKNSLHHRKCIVTEGSLVIIGKPSLEFTHNFVTNPKWEKVELWEK